VAATGAANFIVAIFYKAKGCGIKRRQHTAYSPIRSKKHERQNKEKNTRKVFTGVKSGRAGPCSPRRDESGKIFFNFLGRSFSPPHHINITSFEGLFFSKTMCGSFCSINTTIASKAFQQHRCFYFLQSRCSDVSVLSFTTRLVSSLAEVDFPHC
jgi:hypothetical protein